MLVVMTDVSAEGLRAMVRYAEVEYAAVWWADDIAFRFGRTESTPDEPRE